MVSCGSWTLTSIKASLSEGRSACFQHADPSSEKVVSWARNAGPPKALQGLQSENQFQDHSPSPCRVPSTPHAACRPTGVSSLGKAYAAFSICTLYRCFALKGLRLTAPNVGCTNFKQARTCVRFVVLVLENSTSPAGHQRRCRRKPSVT